MQNTKIEWCDHSLSPWWGCTKVSPGCKYCYMMVLMARWHGGRHCGKGQPRLRMRNFAKNALAMDRKAAKRGRRVTVFPSMCDPFDPEVPIDWFAELLHTIHDTEHLTWLLLTKRPELWRVRLEQFGHWHAETGGGDDAVYDWAMAWLGAVGPRRSPSNVWIGASAEDQIRANQRVPHLLRIPAVVRFLSCEPLLGHVDLAKAGAVWADMNGEIRREYQQTDCHVDWVIVGGESGHSARPMHPDWARSIRGQCEDAGVPFFFKQWGEWYPCIDEGDYYVLDDAHGVAAVNRRTLVTDQPPGWDDDQEMARIGKAAAGRLLDGREHNAFPEDAAPAGHRRT